MGKTDLLGLRHFGKAANTLAKGAVDAASAFLSRICWPAAEEFGESLKDQVISWRTANMVRILSQAEQKFLESGDHQNSMADPRLVFKVFEEGTWIEDETIQDMWAGLLASSCTDGEIDDSNLIFTNLLSDMTTVEARVLNYLCEQTADNGYISTDANGLLHVGAVSSVSVNELIQLSGAKDVVRLAREFDHMHTLGLFEGEPESFWGSDSVDPCLTALALQLYVRAAGSRQSAAEFFKLEPTT